MTGLEMQTWQRRAIDRILNIDAEKEPDMILGVQRGAPKNEINKAYKALSLLFHPDKCSAPDASKAMSKINTAREKLLLAATSERECMVCMDAPINTRFHPCYHSAVCEGCAIGLLARSQRPQCPVCREVFTSYDRGEFDDTYAPPGS